MAGYEQAWRDHGRLDADGHYNMMISQDTRAVRPNALTAPWVDAWCGALMNSWNRDFVREHYPRQLADLLLPGDDGALSVVFPPPMDVMGRRVVNDTCDFGWVAVWASEMGDTDTLTGLLTHADRYMNPTWRDGTLHYPRNDARTDDTGHRTIVEPLTGNTLLGYARLNVPDGLWGLYNQPWDRAHFAEPLISEVADNVDVTRAVFDRAARQLSLTLSHRGDRPGSGEVLVVNAGESWIVTLGRQPAGPDVVRPGPAGPSSWRHTAAGTYWSFSDSPTAGWSAPAHWAGSRPSSTRSGNSRSRSSHIRHRRPRTRRPGHAADVPRPHRAALVDLRVPEVCVLCELR